MIFLARSTERRGRRAIARALRNRPSMQRSSNSTGSPAFRIAMMCGMRLVIRDVLPCVAFYWRSRAVAVDLWSVTCPSGFARCKINNALLPPHIQHAYLIRIIRPHPLEQTLRTASKHRGERSLLAACWRPVRCNTSAVLVMPPVQCNLAALQTSILIQYTLLDGRDPQGRHRKPEAPQAAASHAHTGVHRRLPLDTPGRGRGLCCSPCAEAST
jgi:hypothetical protein